jgi:hypothetical protein
MINMILDQCLERIRAGRATVAECLARYPDCALELAPLLNMASAIESLPDVTPSLRFKQTMRAYLLHLPIQAASFPTNGGLVQDIDYQPSKAN